jgi:hypothetical protein
MPGASLPTFSHKCLLQPGCRFLIRASGNGALNRSCEEITFLMFSGPDPAIHPSVSPGSHSCFQFHRDIITVGSDNRNMKTVAGTLALALSATSSAAQSRPATAKAFYKKPGQRLT